MKIEYVHASKFGNGAKVADEFGRQMAAKEISVAIHHIDQVRPTDLPTADLYIFSSPGRMGRPIKGMRSFLKRVGLPAGTRYALLTTEMGPKPDTKTGRMPTEEEICRYQHVRPIMHELLRARGLVALDEDKIYVTDIKGPLEDGWEQKVTSFADRIARSLASGPLTDGPVVGTGA